MLNRCNKKLRGKIIGNFVNELRESTFFQIDFKSALNRCIRELGGRKIEQILCYGLGSFRNGVDVSPRYQLALLILIHEYLTEHGQYLLNPVIEVYDPSFESADKETLLAFSNPKFKLILENEYCARKLVTVDENGCILVYMPHLDKYLYNNLLGANWSLEGFSRLVILGNSFKEMIDNETLANCRSRLYYMSKLVSNFQENKVVSVKRALRNRIKMESTPTNKQLKEENEKDEDFKALLEFAIDDSSFKHSDIFNSLAFHLINEVWLINNPQTISHYKLNDWTCSTSCPFDD